MLNVMGLDVDKAKELLGQAGFSNIKTEEVESLKPKGEVIHQSAAKNAEIDVNTEIVLQISKGPEETTGPTQATTPKDPNEPVTIGVQFSLPERDEPYILSIFLNGKGGHRVPGDRAGDIQLCLRPDRHRNPDL